MMKSNLEEVSDIDLIVMLNDCKKYLEDKGFSYRILKELERREIRRGEKDGEDEE